MHGLLAVRPGRPAPPRCSRRAGWELVHGVLPLGPLGRSARRVAPRPRELVHGLLTAPVDWPAAGRRPVLVQRVPGHGVVLTVRREPWAGPVVARVVPGLRELVHGVLAALADSPVPGRRSVCGLRVPVHGVLLTVRHERSPAPGAAWVVPGPGELVHGVLAVPHDSPASGRQIPWARCALTHGVLLTALLERFPMPGAAWLAPRPGELVHGVLAALAKRRGPAPPNGRQPGSPPGVVHGVLPALPLSRRTPLPGRRGRRASPGGCPPWPASTGRGLRSPPAAWRGPPPG
jgi:hypothetical protein